MSLIRSLGTLGVALMSVGASTVWSQPAPVSLQIRPRAGDTLRLRMDQSVEMAGTTRNGEVDVTTCTWKDGRVGIYRGLPKADPGPGT